MAESNRIRQTELRSSEETLRTIGLVLWLAALYAAAFLLLFYAMPVLLVAFGGVLFAVLLSSAGSLISSVTGIPQRWSVLLGLVILLGFLCLAGWFFLPRIADQASQMTQLLPQSIDRAQQYLQERSWGQTLLKNLPSAETIKTRMYDFVASTFSAVPSLLSSLAFAAVIVLVGIYGAFNPMQYRNGFLKLIPQRSRGEAKEVLSASYVTLQSWLLGRIASMILVGVLTGLGLWLVDIPLALTLGVITGLLTFVPNIGAIVAAVPAILMGLVHSPTRALYALIVIVVAQFFESYVITPVVQEKMVSSPPAILIIVQLLMGMLFGTLGLFVASPLVALSLVLVNKLYIEKTLRKEPAVSP